uniref:Uncharacterized protein n=1 Tax=Avena sativa TaxID=4498 RepID=A0ACD5XHR0_AVESA
MATKFADRVVNGFDCADHTVDVPVSRCATSARPLGPTGEETGRGGVSHATGDSGRLRQFPPRRLQRWLSDSAPALQRRPLLQEVFKMTNPCECCQSKRRFIRQINGNFMHSMVIPDWFVKYFGGKTPGTVKLEAANGNISDVGVTENMNRTILQSGWPAFVDANQIEENYSLMFRYLGNARFKVTIFDSYGKENPMCCAGKETPSDVKIPNSRYVDNASSARDGTTQSSSDEGSDSDGCPKKSSCRYCESAKTAALSYTSEEFSEEDNPSLDDSVESDGNQMLSDDYVLSGRCNFTEAQEMEIHALVKKIRPEIPVLVVVMKKTDVIQNARLGIPKGYALKYFPCEDTNVILQLPRKNKNWECKFHIRPFGVSDAGRCNLSFGKFVRDNNVREGDICVFQPMKNVKQRRLTITVHILHKKNIEHSPGGRTDIGSNYGRTSTKMAGVKEEPPSDAEEYSLEDEEHGEDDSEGSLEPPFMQAGRPCLTPAQEKKVLEKIEKIESDPPFYVAIINKSNVHHHGSQKTPLLNLGTQYASRYLGDKFATGRRRGNTRVISLVLQREGKIGSWPTELFCRKQDTSLVFRVLKGWPSFVRDNRLRQRDLCLFKLEENEEPLKMMVYIIRRERY